MIHFIYLYFFLKTTYIFIIQIYFYFSTKDVMPMIPLGLKETKEIDFRDAFKDFILEHYSEDANQYEDAIADFMDTRQVINTMTKLFAKNKATKRLRIDL